MFIGVCTILLLTKSNFKEVCKLIQHYTTTHTITKPLTPLVSYLLFLNAVYFRRGLTCTIGLANDLKDSGQPRAKNGF